MIQKEIEQRAVYYKQNGYNCAQAVIKALSEAEGIECKVRQLQLRQLDLLHSGVILENSYISYEYTGLNELKPEMVEEATRNARIVASKFAEDADCKLGSIKSARQGQFEVESDEVMPHMRKVRVVTTIEYFLK